MEDFNGIGMGLGNLSMLSNAKTRSISAENLSGEKGKGAMAIPEADSPARELGQGWKVSPCVDLKPKSIFTIATIEGPGVISHIWMTVNAKYWRNIILRMYWDGEENPSVEVPYGDFFCNGWCEYAHVNSLPISVNPLGAMNSYWHMPFRKGAKITIENIGDEEIKNFFYQVSYTLTDVPDNAAYFHTYWNRNNPLKYKNVHTLVPEIKGKGQYVGTYIAWGVNNNSWFGEGEIKFFMDGDKEFPTICGTGTEDYFGGAWSWQLDDKYKTYSTPYLGMHQICGLDDVNKVQKRFCMYRWHVMDPIRFEKDLRVTIQALGWRSKGRFIPLQDDISSVAYWYQTEPHVKYNTNLSPDNLEVI